MRFVCVASMVACASAYIHFSNKNCYDGHGATNIDYWATSTIGTLEACETRCNEDATCGCVIFRPSDSRCWKRKFCTISQCDNYPSDTFVKSNVYTEHADKNCYAGHGGRILDSDATAPSGLTIETCQARCDADAECACVTFRPETGKCWKRTACVPDGFETDSDYTTFSKTGWTLPPQPLGTIGNKVLVETADRGEACMDGSAPGYWIRTATVESDSNRWVLYAQGGGWCYNDADCATRATGKFGSSTAWGPFTSCFDQCDGILSDDQATNPDFHGWNAVWIGYCDGASMAGNLDGTHEGLYFRGRANLDAVLDDLLDARGMEGATDVVFAGASAAGLTVYLGLDHVANRMHEKSPGARVVGLADGGFFLDYPTWDTHIAEHTANMRNLFDISAPSTDADCSLALGGTDDAWKCFFAEYVQDYVTSPLFIVDAMYDSWQIYRTLKLDCAARLCEGDKLQAFYDFGRTMKASLASAMSADRGAFVAACMMHVQTISCPGGGGWSWEISGVTLAEAFRNYYFQNTSGPSQLFDEYGYPSNPQCVPPAPYNGWCHFGVLDKKGRVCCDAECGQCGGSGCGSRPGGGSRCCTSRVMSRGRQCSDGSDVDCLVAPGPVALIADQENAQNASLTQTLIQPEQLLGMQTSSLISVSCSICMSESSSAEDKDIAGTMRLKNDEVRPAYRSEFRCSSADCSSAEDEEVAGMLQLKNVQARGASFSEVRYHAVSQSKQCDGPVVKLDLDKCAKACASAGKQRFSHSEDGLLHKTYRIIN